MNIVKILGLPVTTLTEPQVHFWLKQQLQNNSGVKIVFTPNPEILVLAKQNLAFFNILNQADLCLPDGQGIVWFSKQQIKQRITGVDTMLYLLQLAHEQELTVGLVFNTKGLSTQADLEAVFAKQYQNCRLVIMSNVDVVPNVILDIILVGLGAPQQENWAIKHKLELNKTKLVLTVGGGLDFLTKKQQRAPLFFRKIGLEWLWRLWWQPIKRLKRISNAVIVFSIYCLRERIKQ
ncbi:MAG: WecB/TagA/CpsF family glycosyltransferase [Patescibacteria group bacterium]|jgi:N-acetylglucosaminyldiphosphoundecaprenol N-acetyl-beta-D-mannosaminyltransferase